MTRERDEKGYEFMQLLRVRDIERLKLCKIFIYFAKPERQSLKSSSHYFKKTALS
jgi:hypothetical protein